MTTRKRFTWLPVLIALGVLSTAPPPAHAGNVHRSCTASYEVILSYVQDANHRWLADIGQIVALGKRGEDYWFSGRGGCGAAVPNRCRRRASQAALKCMQAHVQNPSTRPAACNSNDVHDYRIGNFKKLVQQAACNHMNKKSPVSLGLLPNPYYVVVTVQGSTWGDAGCGGGNRRTVKRQFGKIVVSCSIPH